MNNWWEQFSWKPRGEEREPELTYRWETSEFGETVFIAYLNGKEFYRTVIDWKEAVKKYFSSSNPQH